MKKHVLITLAISAVVGIVAYKLLWTVVEPKIEHRVSQIGLTENEKAANGPLPGDVSLYQAELECCGTISTPGYFSSLNGAENADSERSSFFPCATFSGSWDGPNQVYAWRSEDGYEGCSYINNRKPGELYILGGDFPPLDGPIPAGPYVAKADAVTGKQIWRTYLDNGNASGRWIANANLNILPDGNIPVAWSNQIVLLDGDTGRILKHSTLPTGDCPVENANFKHMTIAPDGTLIMKDQTRPNGSKQQGTMAIIKGVQDGLKQSNSVLLAVHPATLEVIDEFALPEPCSSPHVVTMFEGRIAIYIGMNESARRYFWDPSTKKLSHDETWQIFPMKKGQSTATAPTPIGDWIAFQLNGAGSKEVASSIVVAHQKDPKRMTVVFPFGELKQGEMSFAPPKCGADIENNMIYSADMGVGKVAGIQLNPATGELQTKFILDNMSTTFQPVIGPKDKRVLVLTNMKKNVSMESAMAMLMTANYKEQVTWHDALTGRKLAESDFFEPLVINSLVVPGFGGRCYFPTHEGFITLQVMPAGKK